MSYLQKYKKITHQKGLTITELMVDLLLSTIVISALVGLYINYKKNYNVQFDSVILNQNAYAVYKIIKNDLQLTGFYGCDSNPDNIEYAITQTYDYNLSNPITAYEASNTSLGNSFSITAPSPGWSPSFDGQMTSISPDAGSDIITIRYANTNPSGILQTATTGSSLTTVSAASDVSANDILLISDCLRTVVFKVSNISGTTITPSQSIGNLNPGAEIYKLNINSYYVKTTDNIPILYRLSNGSEEALVPNIENMQLLFGQDTTGNGITDKFNIASSLADANVTSIEVGILVKSNNKHIQSVFTNSYKLLASELPINTTITINTNNDHYFRKGFDFSIALPNALS